MNPKNNRQRGKATRKHPEHDDQCALFQWAKLSEKKYPELALLYAVPNGNNTSPRQGKWMKDEGLKAGVPDIVLPVARGPFHGLYVELKVGNGKPTPGQKWWLVQLSLNGYCAAVVHGWEKARVLILDYISIVGEKD